jgi:acetylornithine deacetylase
MKGGIVSHVVALETLRRLGIQLGGDVVFCTVTDEESTGAGSWAAAHHGIRVDAGICGEPSGFDAWVACRGGVTLFIDVEGRAGHRDVPQPHWRQGGAVNAIEKMRIVLDGIMAIREDWLTRADHQHSLLAPGDVVPTLVSGGTWRVTYPASTRLTCGMLYPPPAADEHGLGTKVQAEVSERLQAYAQAADPWFIEHPVVCTWLDNDVGTAEIPGDHPLVDLTLDLGKELGRQGRIGGLDSWHDAANFTRIAGIPTFSYGPDGIDTAHAVNECLSVDGLVDHCCVTALTLMRWCGVA